MSDSHQGPWKAAQDVVARQIRGELLLVPIRRSSDELDGFYALNHTAADIWKWASEGALIPEIANRLAAAYEVPHETAIQDATRTIAELLGTGALEPRAPVRP